MVTFLLRPTGLRTRIHAHRPDGADGAARGAMGVLDPQGLTYPGARIHAGLTAAGAGIHAGFRTQKRGDAPKDVAPVVLWLKPEEEKTGCQEADEDYEVTVEEKFHFNVSEEKGKREKAFRPFPCPTYSFVTSFAFASISLWMCLKVKPFRHE